MAASASPATSTTPAASIHLGVRSTGHPEGREEILRARSGRRRAGPRPNQPAAHGTMHPGATYPGVRVSPWSLLGSRPPGLNGAVLALPT